MEFFFQFFVDRLFLDDNAELHREILELKLEQRSLLRAIHTVIKALDEDGLSTRDLLIKSVLTGAVEQWESSNDARL